MSATYITILCPQLQAPKQVVVKLQQEASILELKQQIYDLTWIPPQIQVLILKGRVLRDHQTVRDTKLESLYRATTTPYVARLVCRGEHHREIRYRPSHSMPRLAIYTKGVWVKQTWGMRKTIRLHGPFNQIFELKREIERLEGIPEEYQWLELCGEILDDDNFLANYDFQETSIVSLFGRFGGSGDLTVED